MVDVAVRHTRRLGAAGNRRSVAADAVVDHFDQRFVRVDRGHGHREIRRADPDRHRRVGRTPRGAYRNELHRRRTVPGHSLRVPGGGLRRRYDAPRRVGRDWSPSLEADTAVDPTPQTCVTDLGSIEGASYGSADGEWTADCDSTHRTGRYAKFFTFEIPAEAEVTIELVGSEDPFLFLLEGSGTSGRILKKNDDSRDSTLGWTNSRIVRTLAAGTYTAEATTYGSMRTGDFTLRINVAVSGKFTTGVTSAESDGKFGFDHGDFGSMASRDFEWGGILYSIEELSWSPADANTGVASRLVLKLSKCLRPDEVSKIKIDGTMLVDAQTRSALKFIYTSDECENDRELDQFLFVNTSANPLPTSTSEHTLELRFIPHRPSGLLANGYSPVTSPPTPNSGKIKISWKLLPDADGYEVQYWKECYPSPQQFNPVTQPTPCGSQTAFSKTTVTSDQLRDSTSGDDFFTHEITGLSRNTVATDVDEVYRIQVTTTVGSQQSLPADALAYVSHEPPSENRSNTYDDDGVERTSRFSSFATFPLNVRWQPGAGDSHPTYSYKICNTIADAGSEGFVAAGASSLGSISEARKVQITKGMQLWQTETQRNGFWKNGTDTLFGIAPYTGSENCGVVVAHEHISNDNLSEVVNVSQMQGVLVCEGHLACASSTPPARDRTTAVQSVNIYLRLDNSAVTNPGGICSEALTHALHESGHAFVFYGGWQRPVSNVGDIPSGHSAVDSVVGYPSDNRTCLPTFYDKGALAAVYQSRTSFVQAE